MKTILNVVKYIWTHPANRGRQFSSIYHSIKWQIRKRLISGYVDIKVFDTLRLRCYPDSPSASLVIYCNEYPDYHEMHFMRRYLRPGDAVLDIGANIGVYSLLAASCVGVSGHIVAFEPGLKAYQRLMENISLNQLNNITVHACAVGDQSGYIDFLADCDTTSRIRSKVDFDIPTIKVPVLRLDDVIKLDCALGKMDIEGAEPIALQGAQKLLKKANPPIWLLELNGSLRAFNFSEEVFVAWLTSQGYDICLYDADRLELNFTHFQPWLKSPNVFAVAHDRKRSIAERCGAYLIS